MSCKSKCMGASNLRRRIIIQQLTRTADDSGGWTEAWTTFATVWAEIKPKRSSEKWIGSQTTEVTTHQITIRKLSGIKSEMRISYDSRLFYIKGHINEDEMRKFNIIQALEGIKE